jgi:HK97 family phage portal protein
MKNDLGIEKSAGTFNAKFYSNGSSLGGILTTGARLSADAKRDMRNALQTEYASSANAFKIMILNPDDKYEIAGVSPQDGQYVETRKLLIRKIAAAFKLPPSKLGDDTRSSYASLEQENRAYYLDCINPMLRNIEEAFNQKLFSSLEQDYYVEFTRHGILQGDIASQTQHFVTMLNAKVYTPNEVRALLGFNPIEGGDNVISLPGEKPNV